MIIGLYDGFLVSKCNLLFCLSLDGCGEFDLYLHHGIPRKFIREMLGKNRGILFQRNAGNPII